MTINVTNDKEVINLTREEHDGLIYEYNQAFRYYSGPPPSFESWVKRKRLCDKDAKQLEMIQAALRGAK